MGDVRTGFGRELGLDLDARARAAAAAGRMFLVARTVIDTGIHAMGWTRERANRLLQDDNRLGPAGQP